MSYGVFHEAQLYFVLYAKTTNKQQIGFWTAGGCPKQSFDMVSDDSYETAFMLSRQYRLKKHIKQKCNM